MTLRPITFERADFLADSLGGFLETPLRLVVLREPSLLGSFAPLTLRAADRREAKPNDLFKSTAR